MTYNVFGLCSSYTEFQVLLLLGMTLIKVPVISLQHFVKLTTAKDTSLSLGVFLLVSHQNKHGFPKSLASGLTELTTNPQHQILFVLFSKQTQKAYHSGLSCEWSINPHQT